MKANLRTVVPTYLRVEGGGGDENRSATTGVITRERACGLKAEAETTKKRARVSDEATR
tara:strand:+ start:328 stop:504 length:177 start_codon:yes stop_codon:yes gene_type:complete